MISTKTNKNWIWTILLVFTMFSCLVLTTENTNAFKFEWDSLSVVNETWTEVTLTNTYNDPIIVATPEYTTTTNANGIDAWITNVTNNSFMLRTSDENFAAADTIMVHWIAMERGTHTLPNSNIKIEADKLSTQRVGSQSTGWTCPTYGHTITFTTPFDSNPLVLATRGSDNNPNSWASTFKNDPSSSGSPVTSTQMCIGLQQSKAISPGAITNNETIYWIAMDEGNGTLDNTEYEILWNLQDTGDSGGNWINGYGDTPPFSQSWGHIWTKIPNIIVVGQTAVSGADGSWPVLYDTGDISSINMFVDEANERAHSGSESGGGFAFSDSGVCTDLNITSAIINSTKLIPEESLLLNVTVTDEIGNNTINNVIATFNYPNGTKTNFSLSNLFETGNVNSGDIESGEQQVIEESNLFQNTLKAESGQITMTTTQQTVNLDNEYNINNSFIVTRFVSTTSGTNANPNHASAMIKWQGNNSLNITRYNSGTNVAVSYSIIESQNIDSEEFTADFTSGSTQVDYELNNPLPSDYANSCFIETQRNVKLNSGDTDCNGALNVRGEILNTTHIRLNRQFASQCTGTTTAQVTGHAVCFKDETNVTPFTLSHATNTQNDNYDLSSNVDLTSSFLTFSFMHDDDGVSQNTVRVYFENESRITSDRGHGAVPGTMSISGYVIEFEEGSGSTVQHEETFVAGSTIESSISLGTTVDHNKTQIICSNDISSGTGTNHQKEFWVYNLSDDGTTISMEKFWAGSGQDATITCQAVEWPVLTTFNTGSATADNTKDWVTYNNIDSTGVDSISNITINLFVSIYNNSGSLAYANNNSDLELQLFNGSSSWYSVGALGINSTGYYNITITNSDILTNWVKSSNRDIRIRGINFDYFGPTQRDEINWTVVNISFSYGTSTKDWYLEYNDTNQTVEHSISDIYAISDCGFITQVSYSNLTFNISSVPNNITLIYPPNNFKIIMDNYIEFKWNFSDKVASGNNYTANCSLYLNGNYNTSTTCTPNQNNTLNLILEPGYYNWSINVTDANNETNTSDTWNFTNIHNQITSIMKSIRNINSNIYIVDLKTYNFRNFSQNSIILDFMEENFNSGSFTPSYDFINNITGPYYFGNLHGWNVTFTPISNTSMNYSITGIGDYNLIDNYIVSLE